MSVYDYLILGAVAVCVVLAVLSVVRRKKAGKTCCGSCTSCPRACKK